MEPPFLLFAAPVARARAAHVRLLFEAQAVFLFQIKQAANFYASYEKRKIL